MCVLRGTIESYINKLVYFFFSCKLAVSMEKKGNFCATLSVHLRKRVADDWFFGFSHLSGCLLGQCSNLWRPQWYICWKFPVEFTYQSDRER